MLDSNLEYPISGYLKIGGSMIDLKEIERQWQNTTLPKQIQFQIKKMNPEVMDAAIQGTYEKFPKNIIPNIEIFSLYYPEKWFVDGIQSAKLSSLFADAIEDIRLYSGKENLEFNSDQIFDLFNLIVLRMSHAVRSNKNLQKALGVKLGWF